jgi:hypothetical protein
MLVFLTVFVWEKVLFCRIFFLFQSGSGAYGTPPLAGSGVALRVACLSSIGSPCIGGMGFCPNLTYRKCAQALQRQDASLGPCRYPTVRPKPCWMEVAIVLDKIEAGAVLENCHALINQINARLSAEEPFVDVSSATELLSYLERAASVLASPSISGDANGSPSDPLL